MIKKTSPADDSTVQHLPFDAAMHELEALVDRMAAGQMPLEELIAAYQRGANLLQHCQTKLQVVEEQIKVLEAGQLKPWDGQA